jgi:hypothetical protein
MMAFTEDRSVGCDDNEPVVLAPMQASKRQGLHGMKGEIVFRSLC